MKIQKVCGATSVCVVIAARNESRAADNGQDLEFTDVERRAVFLKGDSRTVEALRERTTMRITLLRESTYPRKLTRFSMSDLFREDHTRRGTQYQV